MTAIVRSGSGKVEVCVDHFQVLKYIWKCKVFGALKNVVEFTKTKCLEKVMKFVKEAKKIKIWLIKKHNKMQKSCRFWQIGTLVCSSYN